VLETSAPTPRGIGERKERGPGEPGSISAPVLFVIIYLEAKWSCLLSEDEQGLLAGPAKGVAAWMVDAVR